MWRRCASGVKTCLKARGRSSTCLTGLLCAFRIVPGMHISVDVYSAAAR